jgi:hypothetical protein
MLMKPRVPCSLSVPWLGDPTASRGLAPAVRPGVAEGKYRVRIVLSDDDPEARRRAAQTVHPRFLQFQASGLTIQVPSRDRVNLALSRQ